MSIWKPSLPPFKKYKRIIFHDAAQVGKFIFQIGEYSQLRQPSVEVPIQSIPTKEIKTKIKYLKKCMLKYRRITGKGRGITAVQIGIPERFSVVYTPEEKLLIIINPIVTKKSKELSIYPEVCMSANPIICPTVRPSWIEFSYYNEEGQKQVWDTKADTESGQIMNRIFQHEIDHMEGIINIDIMDDPSKLILESDPQFYNTATFEKIK